MSGVGGRRYRFLLRLAAVAIFWERLWPRLWPSFAVAGLFFSVALLDVLPRLDGWLHALLLILFAVAAAAALSYAATAMRTVSDEAAKRRIEKDSGLTHRPLNALEDRLAGGEGDEAAMALWRLHLKRMAEAARRLRVRLPAPQLARHDPYGLRAVVVLFLVIGFSAAGGEAPERLKAALSPDLGGAAAASPLSVEAWITPPAYTERPPLFLGLNQQAPDGPLRVPEGSALLVRVDGVSAQPLLKVGEGVTDFETLIPGSYKVEALIEKGERISVQAESREIAVWPLTVIADASPSASLVKAPSATDRQKLRIDYQGEDDYGVSAMAALIALSGAPPTENAELRLPLTLPPRKRGETTVRGNAVEDLTAHRWAGRDVTLRLQAVDERGHKGESATVQLTLPERVFTHPVARDIIAARKNLSDPLKGGRGVAAMDIDAITDRPQRFGHDMAVYLGLRAARSRLMHGRGDEAVELVRTLLWEIALNLEDGGVSIAEKSLKDIQERLMQALDEGAGVEEIERLLDDLQQAMNDYLAALGRFLDKQNLPFGMADPNMRYMESGDLERMIERARELARTGATEAARRMLAELQSILNGIQSDNQPGASPEEMAEAQRLMEELRRLGERQEKLLDQTFQNLRERREMGDEKAAAERQDALRRDLGKLMEGLGERLGDIPGALGEAELFMRKAVEALGRRQPRAALKAQSQALDKLRQGMEGMSQQMTRRMGRMRGVGSPKPGRGGRDPFGRLPGGPLEIPGQSDMREARKILGELRRRAAEQHRPKAERDYIERLLKRF